MSFNNRRRAKRDISEKPIRARLEATGWTVIPLSLSNGPDLLAGRGGRDVLIEVKTGKGKASLGQLGWHAGWRGSTVRVMRSVEDVDALNAEQGR